MKFDDKSSVSTVGNCAWWQRDLMNQDYVNAATQDQCQSSCQSGNGGCSPSKVSLPDRRRITQ